MPPIVCIVGRPKSGKTTLIEQLIPELRSRGYRVATIKHTTHSFEMDTEGKDSWKHSRAGSECAVLSSGNRVALIREIDHDLEPGELARLVGDDFDIILAEGFKHSSEPKIEVFRHEVGERLLTSEEVLAVVTEEEIEEETPRFSFKDITLIVDLIAEKAMGRGEGISVWADGKPVKLLPFLQHLYSRLVGEMVAPLKGVRNPKRIDISIRRK